MVVHVSVQYVATENGLQADEIELLVVKGGCYDIVPLNFSSVRDLLTEELQLLEDHQIMSDVAKISSQNNLVSSHLLTI